MDKIKQFIKSDKGKDILIVFIVILVGICSFELGRLSKNDSTSGIKIEYPQDQQNSPSQAGSAILSEDYLQTGEVPTITSAKNSKTYFSSKKGKKYYTLGCSAGKTIKQENRVYFSTSTEAEGAGYTLSSSCR